MEDEEIRVVASATRCAFCHDQVEVSDRAVCATCLAMHHLECWREHGVCANCSAAKALTLEVEVAKVGRHVGDWIVALADATDKLRRRLAARALGELAPQASPAVPALIGALEDEDPWVRKWACVALGNIGARAAAALQALSKAEEDSDERVRKAAKVASTLVNTKKG